MLTLPPPLAQTLLPVPPSAGSRSVTFIQLATVLVCLGLFLLQPTVAHAETQTATISANTVSATVKDHTDPSAPILVSPTNNSSVTTQKPPFTWEPSTDDVGVTAYRLTIDGSVFISSIATSATENSTYKLEINGDGSLKLTPKNSISDGTHTWKITAFDAAGNSEDSATWTFTIDSQAPNFTLTKIGSTTVNISAQNSSTWPTAPYTISDNPATLIATTEGSSVVEVKVYWNSTLQQTVSTAASGGSWTTILGIVPRDTIITLDFLIRDGVGLTSVLEDIQFTVPSLSLIDLGGGTTPTASPSAASEPTPPLEPGELTPTPPAISPTPTPASIIATILDWNWPGGTGATQTQTSIPLMQEILLTITLQLPEAIAKPLQQAITTPPAAQPLWWSFAMLLAFLLWLMATWLWYLSQWRGAWLAAGFNQWRRVIGPWWSWKNADGTGGMVLNQSADATSPENSGLTPLRFAKISLQARALTSTTSQTVETFFTDHAGRFMSPSWPPAAGGSAAGQYALSVSVAGQSDALPFVALPTDWPKTFSVFSFLHHQYRGGWLSLRRDLPFPSLTVLSRSEKMSVSLAILGRVLGAGASLESSWIPWLLAALLCGSVWGGVLNWLMAVFFAAVGVVREYQKRKLAVWPIVTDAPKASEWLIITSKSAPALSWCVPSTETAVRLPALLTKVICTEIQGVTTKQTKNSLTLASTEKAATQALQCYLN